MTRSRQMLAFGAALLVLAIGAGVVYSEAEKPAAKDQRAAAQKLQKQGNWRDAYQIFRELAVDQGNDGPEVAQDLARGVQCLQRLGRINEIDALLEDAVARHPGNWRLLSEAANQYLNNQHQGFIIAGEYRRGPHRGGGRVVNSLERDRVRAMQLMTQAMPLADADDDKAATAQFYMNLASWMLYNRSHHEAWRLQYLTDVGELPDYDEGYPYWRGWNGAPVDEAGKPVFHSVAEGWETADTDGQRWLWALEQVVENAPGRRNEVLWQRAQFCQNQYGVNTMGYYGRMFRGRATKEEDADDDSGTFALHTLKENETIAKLAAGVKRFELPDEHNHIKLYREIIGDPKRGGYGGNAFDQLAQVFQNRRQYPQAAEIWRQCIKEFGPGNNGYRQSNLKQLVDNWGRFENTGAQPAGEGATVGFRFRNGEQVEFTAQRINEAQLLEDVKAYLNSDPGRVDWNKINIGNIGWRIINQDGAKYLGEEAARWNLKLSPRANHWDRRITVSTPLEEPGAYMLTAKVKDGNVSKVVLWVADTAIIRKQLSGRNYYFVGDAKTGRGVKGAKLNFFGYRQNRLPNNRWQTLTDEFDAVADGQGQLTPEPKDLSPNFTWLITARDEAGRFAYHGFSGVWASNYHDGHYNQVKVFSVTDRPVYRPGQKVKFKFWVRHAQYDKDDVSQFAGRTFPLKLISPKGEEIYNASMETDEFGGTSGEWEIPADGALGQYALQLVVHEPNKWHVQGNGLFRVEEYKKPEYEVSIDAPDKPVMLGEKIEAKIKASYYFGAPVTHATVKYKIERTSHSQNWYPVDYWDWFYEPGYWWFAENYPWYPGWSRWVGCLAPHPWWWGGGGHNPPELVAEREVEIGPDGEVAVEIDTLLAKELHDDTDHKYTITAEVRDASRRTIIGRGDVLVARQPFKVFTWVDRGYFQVGETIRSHLLAQTLDNRPVEGAGRLTLYKVTYRKGPDGRLQPVETPVRRWALNTNDEGRAQQHLRASAAGQYRLSYVLTDQAEHTIEGGYLFNITGEGFDGRDYRFNDVELIAKKKNYAPGEKIELQINTARPNSTVLLFVRPANGVYQPPEVIHLQGKSHLHELKVSKKDMPNFFVEAVTIADGRVHTKAKELTVPPRAARGERRGAAFREGLSARAAEHGEGQADRSERRAARRQHRNQRV